MSLPPTSALARQHDPDRFLCTLFAPAERREALFVLTAFNHELARAREVASSPVATLIRLQWWRDAVEEAMAGAPPRRHEVATPLHAAITAGRLDPESLLAMILAREAEADEGGLATEDDFVTWLRGTAGGWSAAAGAALGAEPAMREVLRGLGAAYGLAGVLRSVSVHATQGRCVLPAERLAREGLAAEAVIADPRLAAPLLGMLAAEGLEALMGARRDVPKPLLAAALPAVLAARDLQRIAAGGTVRVPRGIGDRFAVFRAGFRGRL